MIGPSLQKAGQADSSILILSGIMKQIFHLIKPVYYCKITMTCIHTILVHKSYLIIKLDKNINNTYSSINLIFLLVMEIIISLLPNYCETSLLTRITSSLQQNDLITFIQK